MFQSNGYIIITKFTPIYDEIDTMDIVQKSVVHLLLALPALQLLTAYYNASI